MSRRSGFTLVELVASMAITTILLTALSSAILITGHALPERNSSTDTIIWAGELVDQMAGELRTALSFTVRSPTVIEFKVPDRNADLAPETIRYAWSGTPGDPLTRQHNVGSVVNLAQDVQVFDLAYLTQSVTRTESVTTTTSSGEILLASFDGWAGISETAQSYGVDSTNWASEFFLASSIPDNASKVDVTRVQLQMRQGLLGGAGAFSVAIHRAKGGGNPEPHSSPFGTPSAGSAATLNTSFLWEDYLFSDVTISNPNKEYVIVVKGADVGGTGGDAEVLRYYDKSAPKDDWTALWTSDAGAKWDPKKNVQDDHDFPFYVYGVYEVADTIDTDVTREYLSSVGIILELGSGPTVRVETASQILNEPEVTP